MKKIYSIGHSNRKIHELVEILKKFGIKQVIDVRRFPTSKFKRFKKENIEKSLSKAKINYIHLPELGGFRGGYQKHMQSEEWKEGFRQLKKLASEQATAFMCAERLPFRCHRRWIARKLSSEGWEVLHLIKRERVWQEPSPSTS
jgi:uncharacterized protein (DUF488 family)